MTNKNKILTAVLVIIGIVSFTFFIPIARADTLIIRPTSAGDVTGLTPSAGSNWENVDEVSADDSVTYNHGDAYDLYNLTDHTSEAGDITNIRVYFRFQSSTGASASGNTKIKTGGTEYDGSSESTVTWATYYTDYAQNPKTSAAWTWTDIDALQAGAYVDAGGTPVGQLTQVYVEITYTPVAGDTCTCPTDGSDWWVDTDDNCWLATDCDLDTGTFNLRDTGSGAFNICCGATLSVAGIYATSATIYFCETCGFNLK